MSKVSYRGHNCRSLTTYYCVLRHQTPQRWPTPPQHFSHSVLLNVPRSWMHQIAVIVGSTERWLLVLADTTVFLFERGSGGGPTPAIHTEGRLTVTAEFLRCGKGEVSIRLVGGVSNFFQSFEILHNREIGSLSILIVSEWTSLPDHSLNVVNGLRRGQLLIGDRVL